MSAGISNRAQVRLDQIEKAFREVEIAVEGFDAELDELSGLMSEDVDELVDDLRSEAQAVLRTLGARLKSLHLEIGAGEPGEPEATASTTV